MNYFAHTHPSQLQPGSRWQVLADHLRQVADLARGSAADTQCADDAFWAAAHLAGLLHDLGKYRPEFQQKLLGASPPRERTYHKQAGAAKAAELGNVPVAFAIAGHHGGLPNRTDLESAILSPNGRDVAVQVWHNATRDLPELAALQAPTLSLSDALQADLLTRFLFSCLVDADWTDTGAHERHANGLPPEPPPEPFAAESWLTNLLDTLRTKSAECHEPHVRSARQDVLDACLESAASPVGIYSLTVPTGGGKTLASFAFALRHALEHGFRRIIYVAPYLTILEQNEDAIRSALQLDSESPCLFAHHSLADRPDATENAVQSPVAARRAENWDAPLIVTTSVQFFESLFSNKPSRCRKLHNIGRSVVILDECQSLPPDLVAPTCGMLRQLSTDWNTTVVLCTATQPAFSHDTLTPEERLNATEIIPESARLFDRLKRVSLTWPASQDTVLDWHQTADEMLTAAEEAKSGQAKFGAALCVVNSRRAARELFAVLHDRLDEGVFHLSTSMCPAHRSAVLQDVRQRLADGRSCFLVSTQLIEAGVDLDFPVVLRELAPLEAIIQAAGRCNREGRLRHAAGLAHGRVVVFRSRSAVEEPRRYFPPDRWYLAGRTTLENHFLSAGRNPQIDSPDDIHEYFTRLYHTGTLDKHSIQDRRRSYNFADVAQHYRLIDQDGQAVVVATWTSRREHVEQLVQRVRRDPSRANFRALMPYQLNLRFYELRDQARSIAPISDHIEQPVWYGPYDDHLGLNPEAADDLLLI